MSQKECVITKGSHVFTREHFDSNSTCSSNGSTTSTSNNTTSTEGSSCSFSSFECSSADLRGSGLSSPLALPCAHFSCKLSPPLKLPSINSKPSSSPSSLRKVDHNNQTVKRSIGLMKLRRQGSHPPAPASRSHGSINQAAAAKELMASLERLSLKEKTKGTNEEREKEAQRALLGGDQSEKSVNAAAAASSSRNGRKAELPLTAKIAAAMDAEGRIGVQEEISLQCSKYKSRVVRSVSDHYSPSSSFKTCKSRKPRDYEFRPVAAARKMHSTLSSRWIILRRLRSSRTVLGKIWRNLRRVFSSSSRKTFRKELFEVNT